MKIKDKTLILLLRITGGYHFSIGIIAYLFPAAFYVLASYTGEFSQHFIQDVGASYITAGSMLILATFRLEWRLPLSIAGGTFLLLHALLHLYETISGIRNIMYVLMEVFTIMLPTILVVVVVVASLSTKEEHC